MSCYEWERGTIIIPANQWAGFKKALRETYNKALEADFQLAEKLIARVKANQKGKRNVDWACAVREEIYASDSVGYGYGASYGKPRYEFRAISADQLCDQLVTHTQVEGANGAVKRKTALRTLKKKDFPAMTTRSDGIQGDDASIHFEDAKRCVTWSVSENNHAVDRAREWYLGQTLFALLRKIVWGRNSGGCIVGNNEYNRDSDAPGGGGNLLKETFGPLGEQTREQQYGAVRRSRRAVR